MTDAAHDTSSLGGTFNNPGSALLGTLIAKTLIGVPVRRIATSHDRKIPPFPHR